jgi:hypothetical protein
MRFQASESPLMPQLRVARVKINEHADPGFVEQRPSQVSGNVDDKRRFGRNLAEFGSIQAVRGRILYDFSGTACEGYTLQFRQVSELDTGEGRTAVSDLRSTTWEDGGAKSFRFNSQNFLNQQLGDNVEGRAERQPDGVAVKLAKPQDKSLTLDRAVVFPSEHMRRILAAAREGRSLLARSRGMPSTFDRRSCPSRTSRPDIRANGARKCLQNWAYARQGRPSRTGSKESESISTGRPRWNWTLKALASRSVMP